MSCGNGNCGASDRPVLVTKRAEELSGFNANNPIYRGRGDRASITFACIFDTPGAGDCVVFSPFPGPINFPMVVLTPEAPWATLTLRTHGDCVRSEWYVSFTNAVGTATAITAYETFPRRSSPSVAPIDGEEIQTGYSPLSTQRARA